MGYGKNKYVPAGKSWQYDREEWSVSAFRRKIEAPSYYAREWGD